MIVRRHQQPQHKHDAIREDQGGVGNQILTAEGHEKGSELDDPQVNKLRAEATHLKVMGTAVLGGFGWRGCGCVIVLWYVQIYAQSHKKNGVLTPTRQPAVAWNCITLKKKRTGAGAFRSRIVPEPVPTSVPEGVRAEALLARSIVPITIA